MVPECRLRDYGIAPLPRDFNTNAVRTVTALAFGQIQAGGALNNSEIWCMFVFKAESLAICI